MVAPHDVLRKEAAEAPRDARARTIRDKLIGYLERSRKTRKERSANAILTFLRASAKASPISRMVREALKRVKHLQRAFRRFLAMRAAKIQMAVEQWNWFEHKRVLKLERRKKQKSKQKEARGLRASFGDGGAGGGVKFGVAFGGAEDSKVGVAFKEGEQESISRPSPAERILRRRASRT